MGNGGRIDVAGKIAAAHVHPVVPVSLQRRASRIWTGAFLFLKFSFASFARNRLVRTSKRRHHPFGLTKREGRPTQRSMHLLNDGGEAFLMVPNSPSATWVLRKKKVKMGNEMRGNCRPNLRASKPKSPEQPLFSIFSGHNGLPTLSSSPWLIDADWQHCAVRRLPTRTTFRCHSVVSDTPPDKPAAGETDVGRIILWAYYAEPGLLPRHPGASAQKVAVSTPLQTR